jgi:hypothetical protein
MRDIMDLMGIRGSMEVVTPSDSLITLLRDISHANFRYASTKDLCDKAGYRLEYDEPDLGFVRCIIPLPICSDAQAYMSVQIAEKNKTASAFIPLFYFEEYEKSRVQFDDAFCTLKSMLASLVGPASMSGKYSYPHRSDWYYSFTGWELPDITLVLVQDEFDIQFGMDITLWAQPARSAVTVPIKVIRI